MNKLTILRLTELITLFVFLPLVLLLSTKRWLNITLVLSGFAYCLFMLKGNISMRNSHFFRIPRSNYLKLILLRFIIAALFSTVLMYFFNRDALFSIVIRNTRLWLMISVFYSLFSVLPQEVLFRTFFFNRYESIFLSKKVFFVLFNAAVFAFAHIFFRSAVVLILTFIGGVFFAHTYIKTKSLFLCSIEHALYGFWLFTLGAGEMLAFPGG